jgi:hypothetical protein
MSAPIWYCRIGNAEYGPFTSADLKRFAGANQLTQTDLVRQGADGTWVPAARVKGLLADASAPAPSAPVPVTPSAAMPVTPTAAMSVAAAPAGPAAPTEKRERAGDVVLPSRPLQQPAAPMPMPHPDAFPGFAVAPKIDTRSESLAESRGARQRRQRSLVALLLLAVLGGAGGTYALLQQRGALQIAPVAEVESPPTEYEVVPNNQADAPREPAGAAPDSAPEAGEHGHISETGDGEPGKAPVVTRRETSPVPEREPLPAHQPVPRRKPSIAAPKVIPDD